MKKPISSNQILLSAAYAIILLLVAYLINVAITWACNNYLFDVLDWYNRQAVVWRIFLLIAGAGTLISITGFVINMAFSLLIASLFKNLKQNNFIIIWSGVLYAITCLWTIITLFRFWPGWSFWLIIEFALICMLIVVANYALLILVKTNEEKEVNIVDGKTQKLSKTQNLICYIMSGLLLLLLIAVIINNYF